MSDATSVASARRIDVEPVRALVDERLAVRLSGFEPGQQVTVRARMTPTVLTIAAELDGQVVATTEVERLWASPDLTRTEVRDDGMIGAFYQPGGPGPHPAILLLGGSGGGLAGTDIRGALLASHG